PGTVYATEFVLTIDGSNYPLRFRTTDAGKSWRELAATPGDIETRSWHVVLAVDPKNADHVFANDAYVLYESKDGGQRWTQLSVLPRSDDWVNMTFDASNNWVTTGDRDLYSYSVPSKQWGSREGNLQVTEFWDLTLDPKDPDRAYGIAQDHFDAMRFDGSILWQSLPGDAGNEYGKVLIDPINTQRLYVFDPLDPDNLVRRSTDGGNHWTTIRTTSADSSEKEA